MTAGVESSGSENRLCDSRNVVKFYGVVNKSGDKAMIVMELVIGGSLDDHLRKSKNVICFFLQFEVIQDSAKC
ncbi:hypothetical protein KIN20_001218 [Parelaphostrongylus tenuis]|uniref:Serine-threonine/tyrosine-protein kinase catalytic domain-containing protein n=1 Tax=Parelaphostrongylus tenuis TaxID=148309 RepID=A0AAD5LTT0_PARTN|nr:hypothetical protein KIN20_001218 [Parelaphostrongylus tenuis]